ncbi:MAG: serpin family protein [Lachnospiraceae bacterium]
MIKKGMFIAITVIAVVCIFSACADKVEKVSAIPETEEKENKSPVLELTSLTEDTTQSVCIDYVIESYENIQKFGYDLFAQCIDDENPVFSPVSAYLALSMATCGADGTTREELYSVLGNDLLSLSDDMMNRFSVSGDILNLSVANSAWIDSAFAVNDTWLGTVKSLMDAGAFQEELSTEQTMNKINDWISDKTNRLIDTMLTEPLAQQTRLALFNTVYFKGKWKLPFEPQNTHSEAFYLQKKQENEKQVEMMNLYSTDLEYLSNDFMEGVLLPYQNNGENCSDALAFIALKPIGENHIREVYQKLTDKVIADILSNKQTEIVNLKLPKFEVTFDKKLNESLMNIGLVECFDEEKANFDQLGRTIYGDTLYINLVRQKAKIIVDEEGTEAAAATEVLMKERSAMIMTDPKELYFNEPFIYIIMDMETEVPLFIGILDNPN